MTDSTTTTTDILNLDGVLVRLDDSRLNTIPNDSWIMFATGDTERPERIVLTGMTAAQATDAIKSLPANMHGDTRGSIPGRARNLISSAIEDGWVVTVDLHRRYIRVCFHAPVSTVQAVLQNLASTVGDRNWAHSGAAIAAHVTYGWDVDASAMRIEDLSVSVLNLMRTRADEAAGTPAHYACRISVAESNAYNLPASDRLTWKAFTEHVHADCPHLVDARMIEAAKSAQVRAAVESTWDTEADTPSRQLLRQALVRLRTDAEDHITSIEQRVMPAFRTFRDGGTGPEIMANRHATVLAEQYLVSQINNILATEGQWLGDDRLHIDDAFTRSLSDLIDALLSATAGPSTSSFMPQHIANMGHAIAVLRGLATVTTTIVPNI